MTLLERRLPISRLVTMVQKEVADRMVAEPGTKAYGALSVAVQYYTQPHVELDVPPRSFIPAPEVDSVVIVCDVREEPPVTVADEKLFFRVVRAAFGQRRKTLSNALKGAGFDKELIRTALPAAGIDGTRRGETLSLTEFAAIATAFLKSV
jgi:16S rRNA (adenine1518-N6/adenine1519-N6)-dimethyltransferase